MLPARAWPAVKISASACKVYFLTDPYMPLARAAPQVSNLRYRRFPNRRAVQGSDAPACGAASGLGNPRDGRLGSLRYKKAASSRPLDLKTVDACEGQGPGSPFSQAGGEEFGGPAGCQPAPPLRACAVAEWFVGSRRWFRPSLPGGGRFPGQVRGGGCARPPAAVCNPPGRRKPGRVAPGEKFTCGLVYPGQTARFAEW
jgi:hypothetical protein